MKASDKIFRVTHCRSQEGDHIRLLPGFSIYINGEVMVAMIQKMNHFCTEMQMGLHCYHVSVTAMYGWGASAPSNQACVGILLGINKLVEVRKKIDFDLTLKIYTYTLIFQGYYLTLCHGNTKRRLTAYWKETQTCTCGGYTRGPVSW